MKMCITCNTNPRRFERRECNTCIARKQRERRKQGALPVQFEMTGDLFRDELILALRKIENLPLIGEGMST